MNNVKQLANHAKVEIVDDERNIGNSIIITLKQGWTFEPGIDNRVSGADNVKNAFTMVRSAHKFDGPYED